MWEVIYLDKSIAKLKKVFEQSISNYIILYLRKDLIMILKDWVNQDNILKLAEKIFNNMFEKKNFVMCETVCLDIIRYYNKRPNNNEIISLWQKKLESVQEWMINQAIAKRNALRANYLCENMIELAKLSWEKRKMIKWLGYNQIAKTVLYEEYVNLWLNNSAKKVKEDMISFYNWLDIEPQIKQMWLENWESMDTNLPINDNIVLWGNLLSSWK